MPTLRWLRNHQLKLGIVTNGSIAAQEREDSATRICRIDGHGADL
jgi:hypothetical protein